MKIIAIILFLCILLFSCADNKNDATNIIENHFVVDYVAAENNDAAAAAEENPVFDSDSAQNKKTSVSTDETTALAVSELLWTGEIIAPEQMETIKVQALSWQSSRAGIGGFADVVAVEPSVYGADQQVYIGMNYGEGAKYERRIQVQAPDGTQARLICALSGAGSGELEMGYRLITKDSEWIEFFYSFAMGRYIEDYIASAWQWQNDTAGMYNIIKMLYELPLNERQFK